MFFHFLHTPDLPLAYILLIPVGIAVGRSYHCVHGVNGDPDNVMDTDNSGETGPLLPPLFCRREKIRFP